MNASVDAWPVLWRTVRNCFGPSLPVRRSIIGKLSAVFGQDPIDLVGDGCHQIMQKVRGTILTGSSRCDVAFGTQFADLATSTLARDLLTAAEASIQ